MGALTIAAALAVVAGASPGSVRPTVTVRVFSANHVMVDGEEMTLAGYERKLREIARVSPRSDIVLKLVGGISQDEWDRMKSAISANGLSGSATTKPLNLEAHNLTSLPEIDAWVGKAQ